MCGETTTPMSNAGIRLVYCIALTTLKYFCKNHGNQRVFKFEIIINVLASSFRFI